MKNKFNTATFLRQLALTLLAVMLTATAAWADEEPKLSGSGTESAPYLITSAADWSTFASRVSGGDTYSGKYFNLTADITVREMVGTVTDDGNLEHPFSGTFNGCGHTLTFNLSASDDKPFEENYAAPFRCVDGATFRNLHIDGEIKISKKWAAGLIGYAAGDIVISSCWSSVTITSSTVGDGTHAGFIAFFIPQYTGSINIENSLFDGKFVGKNTIKWGGFVGWSNSQATFTNCLFAPTGINVGDETNVTEKSGTFIRKNDPVFTITNCYYTNNTLGECDNSVDASEMSSADLAKNLGNNFEVSNNKVVLKLKGSGTETNPYIITTTAELDALSELVNNGNAYEGKYFKLGANITYSYAGLGETESNFTAIGSWDNPFKGNFDGDDHTISGIRIYKPDNDYQGLFGCIENANVENIILTDAKITGYQEVSGIAGACSESTIRKCIVDNVFVNGSSQGCGGIAGDAYWGTLVDNLIVNSTITVANPDEYICTGAITGDNVSPENNYYYNCKVIVGETEHTTDVGCGKDVTLPHDIDGARQAVQISAAEGITFQRTSDNSLTYKDQIYVGVGATVTLTISDDKGYKYYTNGKGVYFTKVNGNSYNFTVTDANNIVITGTNEVPVEGKISISAIDNRITILPKENAVLLDDKCYAEEDATVTIAINDAITTLDGFIFNGYTYAEGNPLTKNADGNYTFTVPSDGVTISRDITDFWGITNKADGSADHPYIITTPAGLDLLATKVNSDYVSEGKYFKLGADITYSYDGLGETQSNFTAIGSWDNPFKGNFDGDGKKISGIRIYKPDDVDHEQGLFGYIENANVENIILTDAKITGYQDVSGIAGSCDESTIRNCIVDNVFVNGSSQGCGGIVGSELLGTLVGNLIVNSTITVANPDEYIFTGAITGYNDLLENNYYYNCKVIVGETEHTTDVGCGQNGTLPHDIDGALQAVQITADEGISFEITSNNAITYGNQIYAAKGATVTFKITDPIATSDGVIFNGYTYAEGNSLAQNADGNYTFTVPSDDVTISRDITDFWGITNKADGSAEHPYIITTPAGLDLLATKVNSGYVSEGKYFKLGNNITYSYENLGESESNFTAIGSDDNSFNGNFDGDGYTISGIRIYKPNDEYQGFFGYIHGATIENIKLADAVITGHYYIGGIAGCNEKRATINNCTVASGVFINASKDNASCIGGIVGYNEDGVISKCTVASDVSINAGKESRNIGGIAGDSNHGYDVFSPIIENCISSATITVPGGNTCSNIGGIVGESYEGKLSGNLVINATIPAASKGFYGAIVGRNVDATLQNNFYYNTTVNGVENATNVGCGNENAEPSDITENNGAVHAEKLVKLTLPECFEITSGVIIGVDYVEQGAKIQFAPKLGYQKPASVSIHDGASLSPDAYGFYTVGVDQDMTIDAESTPTETYEISTLADLITFSNMVNKGNGFDGKTVTLMNDINFNLAEETDNNFTPIGVRTPTETIPFCGTFDGNGHTISGIRINQAGVKSACGLFSYIDKGATIQNVILSDIIVTGAVSAGLVALNDGGPIKHNFVNGATISGSEAGGAIVIDYGKGSIFENNYYYNCKVNGKTSDVGSMDGDITTNDGAVHLDLIIDGDSEKPVSISETKENQTVIYTRTLTADIFTTIILPFDFTAAAFGNDEFYTFTGVDEKTWEATMTKVAPKSEDNVVHLNANTPYIFKPSAETAAKSEFVFTNVTIKPTTGEHTTKVGGWEFHGTYEKKVWNEDPTKTLPKETTNVYGFAAKAGTNQDKESCEAGEFVRAGYNVSIKPTRAYLEYKGTNTNLLKSALVLPDRIKVVFIDKETASVIDDPTVNPSADEDGDITTPTSEIQPTANVKVWSYDKTIFIQARPGTDYRIIDANGRTLRTATTQTDRDEIHLSGKADGIVIVNIGGKSFKIRY